MQTASIRQIAFLILFCGTSAGSAAAPASSNPLLAKWPGPYGGVPPFDRIRVEHFEPALETAMAENLAEIEAIASNPAKPDFENTIAAFERAGRTLARVSSIYGIFATNMDTPEFQAVETKMNPKLAELTDRIFQNERLFTRIAAVYEARESSNLTPEQKRLVWLDYTNFVRAGARLDKAAKERTAAINQRLATLYTSFSQNVLADESDHALLLEKESDLAGLPGPVRASAAAAAEARGQKGKWAVLNTRSSMEPFLLYSGRRDLREKVWRTYYSRGDNGDAKDTKKLVSEILALRAERAALLGYATYAHWRLESSMAKTPERALELMEAVWKPAVARVHEEVADMQAIATKEGAGIEIAPWDYRYYSVKVKQAKYDADRNVLAPYLQLEKLREGLFWTAGELFGLRFRPAAGVPVVHPDVRVWEVIDAAGKHVALWYFDPYARPGKGSGAWMNAYRAQERFDGEVTTIVSNNTNFVKGKPGEPVLVSWDDGRALFHEFGHAIHGILSSVTYPSLSGTSVPNDYGEFPSNVLERWLMTPEVLRRMDASPGGPISPQAIGRIERASKFNQGFITVEYLSSALVDMRLHLAAKANERIDPDRFEKETLAALGMPKEMVMRHRTPQFGHLFASESYAAGYYSYLWSDVLAADGWSAFEEAGSPWDKATAKRLRDNVLSVGNTVDPDAGYRAFRGRDPRIEPLMKKRGFPMSAAPAPRSASAAATDPIEGKWYGTAGFPQDRVELGLEFKRDEKGELKAYLYQPVINFYGLELPGVVTKDGDTYVNKEYAISATLREDPLEGTYHPLKAPMKLKRADSLPTEVPVPDLPKGPGPSWQVKLGGAIYAPAAVRDGVAYVGTTGGILNAVRVSDGGFLWMFVAGRPIHGEALVTDDHVFFVCDNGYLFKLERKTGKEVWRYDLGDERVSRPLEHQILSTLNIGVFDFDHGAPQPVLADAVLYVPSGDGSLHAVDAEKGSRIWRFEGKGKARTTPLVDAGRVTFGTYDGIVYAVDRKSGKEIWKKDTRAEVTSEPVVVGDRLIVGNRGGLLAALDPGKGDVVWRMLFWGSSVESTPVPGEGSVFYIGSSDLRRVSAIDAKDGRVLWRTDVYGWPWARPALAGQRIYASAAGGDPYQIRHLGSLSALDRATGRIIWRWPMPGSPGSWVNGFAAAPAVDGNTVVVGGLDGSLYGFPAS